MFSVVNAVLLRPLPYRDPGRLVAVLAQIPSRNIVGAHVEYNTYAEWWLTRTKSFESMSAFAPGSANLTLGNEAERVPFYRVTAGFLGLTGLAAQRGREFLPEEDRPGAARVAMLSEAIWKRRFGADPGVIGRTVLLDRNSYTVVGIVPPEFELYGANIDVYAPMAAITVRGPGAPTVGVHARLKPGVSVATAQAEIDGLCKHWVEQYGYPKGWGARVWPLRDFYVREVRTSMVVLAVAVALVLLIACANVANLLLARAAGRQREIAIRTTLGAGGARIVRQLLTESGLLALLALALGLGAAWAGVRALAASTAFLPFQGKIAIDASVLAFTLAAALATTLVFGLAPALAAARTNLLENLKEGGRGGGDGVRRSRFRSALVVTEVALALLLTVGATLATRSLMRLQAIDPGFHPEGVLTAYLTLPVEGYSDAPRRVNFFRALGDRLRALPGVKEAGLVSHLPFSRSKSGADVRVEGAPEPRPGESPIVFFRSVDSRYFNAIRARLLRGRFFNERDPAGPPVAVINETMARHCWPGQDPVGKRFSLGRNGPLTTVTGLIADMRQTSLADDPDPEAFLPYRQRPGATMAMAVSTTMDPMALAPAIRAAVRELDKDLAISDVGILEDSVARSTRSRRFSAALLGAFGGLALVLAAVGIYGVISYSVSSRTHEMGVRMALGAERGRIVALVIGKALLLGGGGVTLGVAGAFALTRLMRSMLYGVSATDPAVFTGVSLFLLAVAAAAGYLPARRAACVDPIVALRNE